MLIALTAQFDWELDQMDIVGTYLNATLPDDKILYMDPIAGLHDGSNKVHRVVKSMPWWRRGNDVCASKVM